MRTFRTLLLVGAGVVASPFAALADDAPAPAATPAAPSPAALPAAAPATAARPAPALPPDDDVPKPGVAWSAARWGMTPAEVVAAFPGRASLQEPPLKLPDGNVVGAGIDGLAWEGLTVNVRFVFTDGKLALVSLRTEQNRYVDAAAYDRVRKALARRWGEPIEESKDDALVDMRQTRWNRGPNRTDVKYIPGVVAAVIYPKP